LIYGYIDINRYTGWRRAYREHVQDGSKVNVTWSTYRCQSMNAIGVYYKNLAIANRSRVSCADNTSSASIINLWRWNISYGSLKVTGNGSIG